MTEQLNRDLLQRWDQEDELAGFREQFHLPDNLIYMNGNSLGVMPRQALARAQDVVGREWGNDLIRSWNINHWIDLPQRLGNKIARLVGADEGEVIVCDSTSVNLFKLAAAAVRMQPGRSKIISEPGNFPTDLYVLQGVEQFSDGRVQLHTVEREQLFDAIDEDTAVVVLTHVHYKSGSMFDMAALTARAHEKGALILWDLSHSTGAVPVDLNGVGADFAIGCGYKYLNGGPGAPAFLFVARRHQATLQQPLSGWFGHANPFAMRDDYEPAPGIERTLCGTTSVIGASVLEVGVDLMVAADMTKVRAKSVKMGELFIALVEQRLQGLGFTLVSSKDSAQRGSQVSLRHEQGYAIMQALIARGVIGDFRAPDILRFGFTPLYLRYVDIWDAVEVLADIMARGEWQSSEYQVRTKVT
ncbi:kynureninase [Pokkaliibacter plantistimulans]|uniref:Kynureninase n=1 Tax=Pokkaliibacter plantistimulans TaxID=1635171 RepID=A0ABX5LV97_9GAMM|nr:kynureninase [Pokkaliibacter plantistimulans]PXF30595.1 kynureninase [Pokkaliibacter plantistimulans]